MKSLAFMLILACPRPAHADPVLGDPRLVLTLNTGPVKFLSFSPDGKKIIVGGGTAPASIYDLKTGESVRLQGSQLHGSASFGPTGTEVYLGGGTNLTSWNAGSGAPLRNEPVAPGRFESVLAFSRDQTFVLTTWKDDAFIRNTKTGEIIQGLAGESHGEYGRICAGAFSRNGELVATTDSIIRIWDARTGKWLKQLVGHRNLICVAAFNPTGDRLVTVDDDNMAILWDVASGNALFTFQLAKVRPEKQVHAIAVSPDGNYFVATQAKGVSLWDMAAGKLMRELGTDRKFTWAAAFSPDGALLAIGGDDDATVIYRMVPSGDDLREFSEKFLRPATITPHSFGPEQAEKAFQLNWHGAVWQ